MLGFRMNDNVGGSHGHGKRAYDDGNTAKIDAGSLSFIHEPYEVIVAFLHPAKTGRVFRDALLYMRLFQNSFVLEYYCQLTKR
jgi:hypothetical protein